MQIYNQYLNMAPTNQQRLMSAYDIKEGKMIMSYFKLKVQQPQSVADYIRKNLEVLAKDIHLMGQHCFISQCGINHFSSLFVKFNLVDRMNIFGQDL